MPSSIIHDESLFVGRQSLNGTLVDSERGLRATIKRDAYDEQSYARIEKWTSEKGWSAIHSVPISATRIRQHTYVTTEINTWRDEMRADLKDLMAFGVQFIGGQ